MVLYGLSDKGTRLLADVKRLLAEIMLPRLNQHHLVGSDSGGMEHGKLLAACSLTICQTHKWSFVWQCFSIEHIKIAICLSFLLTNDESFSTNL
uniref:Uncharacterized protein n=1 Tax=Triticum urartu TaxID=4572 RepID=A0A8R7UD93_TRIUA